MLSSSAIEKEIDQIEKLIATTTQQLDESMSAFAEQLPTIAQEWMEKEIKRVIDAHANRVNEMGAEGVRELKARLADLYAELPELCIRANANQSAWPHRRTSAPAPLHSQQNNDTYFGSVFRKVIEHLGSVLAKFKLLNLAQGRSGNWERVNGDQYKYVTPSLFNARSLPMIAEYEECHSKRRMLETNLAQKRQELQKAKAQALWDST